MEARFQCKCGALTGAIKETHRAYRGICYCKDCRAYSKHLGALSITHDAAGGADFVCTTTRHISFVSGIENLACLSLSSTGLLRWYAKCCNTPICNTTRSWKIPYVSFVRTCFDTAPGVYENVFPLVQMCVNRGSALTTPPSKMASTFLTLARLASTMVVECASSGYRKTPLFTEPDGAPLVEVIVLTPAQRQFAYSVT
ncbi:MAG: DUF6151 family protein [Methylophilaceae bacterium]